MNARRTIYVLAVVCLLVCVWLLRKNDGLGRVSIEPEGTAEASKSNGIAQASLAVTSSNGAAKTTVSRRPLNQMPHDAKWQQLSNSIQWRWQQINRSIEFYGKVIDQSNQPVAGAIAHCTWTQFEPGATFQSNVVTDTQGLFALKGVTGASLNVQVAKDGYYTMKTGTQDSFHYSVLMGAEAFEPNSAQPVIFRMLKKPLVLNL